MYSITPHPACARRARTTPARGGGSAMADQRWLAVDRWLTWAVLLRRTRQARCPARAAGSTTRSGQITGCQTVAVCSSECGLMCNAAQAALAGVVGVRVADGSPAALRLEATAVRHVYRTG